LVDIASLFNVTETVAITGDLTIAPSSFITLDDEIHPGHKRRGKMKKFHLDFNNILRTVNSWWRFNKPWNC
jgi:hypothetical protein